MIIPNSPLSTELNTAKRCPHGVAGALLARSLS